MLKQLKEEKFIDIYTLFMSTWWSLVPKLAKRILEVVIVVIWKNVVIVSIK